MKNLKFWALALLTSALIFAVFYMGIAQIDEKLQERYPETTETAETEPQTVKDTETKIIFTPIETEEVQPGSEEVSDIYAPADEVLIEPVTVPFTVCNDSDLMLIAKLIQSEAGYDFCSDAHQRAVASVLLNHVASTSPDFPDSVYGCIFSGWVDNGIKHYGIGSYAEFMAIVPSERAIANAQYVMTYGSTVGDAIYQAEFIQGEIVAVFEYPGTGAMTTYICR